MRVSPLRFKKNKDGSYPLQVFPGADPELTKAALDVHWGQLPNPRIFNVHKHTYYSARAYAAAGATSFTFFDGAPTRYVDNMPQQGQINDDQFFWLEAVSFQIIPNVTITALAQTQAASGGSEAIEGGYFGDATTLPDALNDAGQIMAAYQLGLVNVRVGERVIVDDVFGLQEFAPGSGPFFQGAAASNSATTAAITPAITNNGAPNGEPGWALTPIAWLTKGRSVRASVDYRTAVPLNAAGVIVARLHGTLIRTGNT